LKSITVLATQHLLSLIRWERQLRLLLRLPYPTCRKEQRPRSHRFSLLGQVYLQALRMEETMSITRSTGTRELLSTRGPCLPPQLASLLLTQHLLPLRQDSNTSSWWKHTTRSAQARTQQLSQYMRLYPQVDSVHLRHYRVSTPLS